MAIGGGGVTPPFKVQAKWFKIFGNASDYLECGVGQPDGDVAVLKPVPLDRQLVTAREILYRIRHQRGVLLADDVGLGKTTVAALVAWAIALQDGRVRILAPNKVMERRWASELARHIPYLHADGAKEALIKQGNVARLDAGRIQITTHQTLVKSHGNDEKRTACDLMIIDEAHRAKGENTQFNQALDTVGDTVNRRLILTATPFSIGLAELERLLDFVGAEELGAVGEYSRELHRLYQLRSELDVEAEAKRLGAAAKAAVDAIRPFVIRHGIDDLSPAERREFGAIDTRPWEIKARAATEDEIGLLLRMDRLLALDPERKGARRNDPRFHIGWGHLEAVLKGATERAGSGKGNMDGMVVRHIESARNSLSVLRRQPHPKLAAVSEAVRQVVDTGEKVLVFCHHRATAAEVLGCLQQTTHSKVTTEVGPTKAIWSEAWQTLLSENVTVDDPVLLAEVVRWLSSDGLRQQIGGWIGVPAVTVQGLRVQLESTRPRGAGAPVPTIAEWGVSLAQELTHAESKSTRQVLWNIAVDRRNFGRSGSHYPGRLDLGYRVMGSWMGEDGDKLATRYSGEPDIVLALFNSPFGPDVLVTTDRLSEGVDLHRCCRHLIHYELDPSPVRTLQRNGRIRRVGSWAALTGQPIRYSYPTFGGTRDERAVDVMRQRIAVFGTLLGGVPSLQDEDEAAHNQSFVVQVLGKASERLNRLNKGLAVKAG